METGQSSLAIVQVIQVGEEKGFVLSAIIKLGDDHWPTHQETPVFFTLRRLLREQFACGIEALIVVVVVGAPVK